MAQTIKLKRSNTGGAVPTTSQLALGELAVNTKDGKFYLRKHVDGTNANDGILRFGPDQTIAYGDTTFPVISANKTSSHPYYNQGSGVGYRIDGLESPTYIFVVGNTYKFDQSDSSNSSHQLRFYLDAAKTTAYTTGVTLNGTAGSSGAYSEIVISESTPPILYYQCVNHSYMGGAICVLSNAVAANAVGSAQIAAGAVGANELASTGVSAGSYGSSSAIPVITVDADGRVTSASTAAITGLGANSVGSAEIAENSVGSSEIAQNSVGITQLNVTDGTSGQFLSTDGNGTLSFSSASGGGGSNPDAFDLDSFTGNGSSTQFTLDTNVASENNLIVFIDGTFQNQDSISLSNNVVTFDTAPPNGADIRIYKISTNVVGLAPVIENFTGNGSTTQFTCTTTPNSETQFDIFIDGVYQNKNTFSVSGAVVTFSTAPASGAIIEVVQRQVSDLNGIKGQKGDGGAQGSKGQKGEVGAQGATGPQGSTGPQGTAGATGPQGDKGQKGEIGVTGSTGPKGAKGEPSTVVGPTGPTGPQGTKGQKGDTGGTGGTGGQGGTGPKGEKGQKGDTGAQGPQGTAGATGPQGGTGPQGAKGQKGEVGAQGPTGSQGATGPQGGTGPQGSKGQKGEPVLVNHSSSKNWTVTTGNGLGADGNGNFTQNGDGNSIVQSKDPFGRPSLVWQTRNNDTASNADGGWNQTVNNVDANKAYMSVVYIKRVGTSTNGTFYHGCATNGDTINKDGSANSNPYFATPPLTSLPQDVWCVSIGFIQANNDSNTNNYSVGGLYRMDNGQKIVSYTSYKMASGATTQLHRTYLYYSTDPNASLDWWGPGFYEINGNEPNVDDLIGNPGRAYGYYLNTSSTAQTKSGQLTVSNVISGSTSNSDGSNNRPFNFAADVNGWMVGVTPSTSWGLFWAGSSGAAYGTSTVTGIDTGWNNSSNPNEFAFVSSNGTVWSVFGETGQTWQKGSARVWGDIYLSGAATTTNAARTIYWTGFDKEAANDQTDTAHIRHTINTGSFSGSVLEIAVANDANDGLYLNSTGGVYVLNNLTASGNITANSDIRLKTDIEPIENALEKVQRMRGVTFKKEGTPSAGLIAQEQELITPELVYTASGQEKYKSVAYANLVAYLIEAIKEQQKEINELKEMAHPKCGIETFEGYAELVERLEKLENGNND